MKIMLVLACLCWVVGCAPTVSHEYVVALEGICKETPDCREKMLDLPPRPTSFMRNYNAAAAQGGGMRPRSERFYGSYPAIVDIQGR
jgi:hypothetical protein